MKLLLALAGLAVLIMLAVASIHAQRFEWPMAVEGHPFSDRR